MSHEKVDSGQKIVDSGQLSVDSSHPSLKASGCGWHQQTVDSGQLSVVGPRPLPQYLKYVLIYCRDCAAIIDSRLCHGCSKTYPNPDYRPRGPSDSNRAFGHAFYSVEGKLTDVLCHDCWLDLERDELENAN